MNYSSFSEILIRTTESRFQTGIMLLILVLGLLAFDVIYLVKAKSTEGVSVLELFPFMAKTQKKLSLKEQIGMKVVAVAILICLLLWWGLPVYKDISQQQYIEVYAYYSNNTSSSTETNWLSFGHVYIITDGKEIRLELPADWTSAEFPPGEYWGTVCYSKDSRIILSFKAEQ